ncbi:MAG TPA: colicin immunity domain-containing protein [Pseudonocardiaceae bacterium]
MRHFLIGWRPSGKARNAAPYIEIISRFTSGQISASEFEAAYIALFSSETKLLPKVVATPINEVFYDIDDYVSDPELRAEMSGLDDEQLRERVAVQLQLLVEAVESEGQQMG